MRDIRLSIGGAAVKTPRTAWPEDLDRRLVARTPHCVRCLQRRHGYCEGGACECPRCQPGDSPT